MGRYVVHKVQFDPGDEHETIEADISEIGSSGSLAFFDVDTNGRYARNRLVAAYAAGWWRTVDNVTEDE